MKIIIVTTKNENMRETGFGKMKACYAVESALKRKFDDVCIKSCTTLADLESVANDCPDIVFLAVKYIQLENESKVWLSEFFENASIIFTGSKRDVLEYDSNKIKAKELIKSSGIATADYLIITPQNYFDKDIKMNYPIFLKPLDAANGNGIDNESLAHNSVDFVKKTEKLFSKYGDIVIAEKYLSGREFTVAIVRDFLKNKFVVSPIEIVPPKNIDNIRILGEQVKNENTEQLKAIKDDLLRVRLKKIALDCFEALGARDFARIDIKMDDKGVCHFIEANLVPGMTEGSSYFPKSFEIDRKLEYFQVVDLILGNALSRLTSIEDGGVSTTI